MVRFRRTSGVGGRLSVFDNSIVPGVEVTIGKSLRAPTSMLHRFELCEPITWVGDARYGLGWGSRLGSFVLHPDRGSEGDAWKASASLHGKVASPFKAAYIAAKHGVLGLTKVLALEVAEHGITSNAICPAYVRTPLVEKQIEEQARRHGISREDVVQKIMLEPAAIRRLLEPEEVAALAVYLCSDKASGMTGAAIDIDLGWTAR